MEEPVEDAKFIKSVVWPLVPCKTNFAVGVEVPIRNQPGQALSGRRFVVNNQDSLLAHVAPDQAVGTDCCESRMLRGRFGSDPSMLFCCGLS